MHTNHSTNPVAAQGAISLVDRLKLHGIAEQAKAANRRRSERLGKPELASAVVAQMITEMEAEGDE